jgi:hypothetical protein
MAFGGVPESKLDTLWGQSGKTIRQVWQEYKDWDSKWHDANDWLECLLKGL